MPSDSIILCLALGVICLWPVCADAQTAQRLDNEPVSITVVSVTNVARMGAGIDQPIKDTETRMVVEVVPDPDDAQSQIRTTTLMY